MTNWRGIERVVYIYNLSACACSQPYFHSPLLYTELCEVLWAPKLCWFPNKAGLCPAGTNWGLFRPSGDHARRERPPALWFWLHLLKRVLGSISGQLHASLVLTSIIATDTLPTAHAHEQLHAAHLWLHTSLLPIYFGRNCWSKRCDASTKHEKAPFHTHKYLCQHNLNESTEGSHSQGNYYLETSNVLDTVCQHRNHSPGDSDNRTREVAVEVAFYSLCGWRLGHANPHT